MKLRYALALAAVMLAVAVPAVAKKNKDKAKDEGATPAVAAAPAAAADSTVVATVGDVKITEAQLLEASSNELAEIRQKEYEIKSRNLQGLIQQALIDKEATARGITSADLLKAEVEDKTAPTTKEEKDRLYDQNKARLGGRTREDMEAQLESAVMNQHENQRRQAFLSELQAKADVKVLLDPPRTKIDVPADAFAMGPTNAPVTIVEFSDYQCPFCRRAHPTVQQLLADYGDKIRFVYRDYPLSFHPRAMPASIAARCAADQDKFWEMHTNLMEVQGDLSDADLTKRAADLGLNAETFASCFSSKKYQDSIQSDFQAGASVGVTGTPAFFINGRMITGAQPLASFKEVVDDELSRRGVETAKN